MAIKRKIDIYEEKVKVTARFREEGSVLRGDARGWSEGFTIEIEVNSDSEEAEIADLMRLAHQMCFTEDVIGRSLEIETHHVLNGVKITL